MTAWANRTDAKGLAFRPDLLVVKIPLLAPGQLDRAWAKSSHIPGRLNGSVSVIPSIAFNRDRLLFGTFVQDLAYLDIDNSASGRPCGAGLGTP